MRLAEELKAQVPLPPSCSAALAHYAAVLQDAALLEAIHAAMTAPDAPRLRSEVMFATDNHVCLRVLALARASAVL